MNRLETKAPLYSHFIESLNGLVTIRAFGWAEAYKNKNLRLLDASQKPFYLLLCIQRWLILVLDLVVAALTILIITLAVALRSKMNSGFLGIALVNMMSFGQALASFVDFWTSLETSLGAVARIKDFSEDTPSEFLPEENGSPGSEWPTEGSLSFEGVSASYKSVHPIFTFLPNLILLAKYCASHSPNSPLVLNNITLSISPGQRVGICGRTGRYEFHIPHCHPLLTTNFEVRLTKSPGQREEFLHPLHPPHSRPNLWENHHRQRRSVYSPPFSYP
jgi:ATP-binding cassette, subfamily C (CFTR/MRP), member 1